jgi:hypothetical protein
MRTLFTENLTQDAAGKAQSADPRLVNIVSQAFARADVLEQGSGQVACQIDGEMVPDHVMTYAGIVAFPALAIYQFDAHQVWTKDHERFAKVLARMAAKKLGQAPKKTVEAKPFSFDDMDIDGAIADLDKKEEPPKPKRSKRKSRPKRKRPNRRSVAAAPPTPRPIPTHAQPFQRQHAIVPQNSFFPPDPKQPGHPPAPHTAPPQPQQPEGGLFSSLSSMFSNLFGGGAQQPMNGYGANGYGEAPALPGPTDSVGEWYPDPGLEARLCTQSGQVFEPGAVPSGMYQVEIFNGQSFVPLAQVNVQPYHSYRLFREHDRVRWGQL